MPRPPDIVDIETLIGAIRAGDRKALARAITLIESSRAGDRELAERLLGTLLQNASTATRIGISGAPGAGKSTYIEALGSHATGLGKRLAVLAVDPSSARSGGSILGDKTRMASLARNPRAFIRPTPAGDAAGGVGRRTRETLLLAEAAGFDIVVVETVGVGQSETAVCGMVDLFVLLVAPGGGDDLQGIKRGAMELADLVLVTKADGELAASARRAAADYRAALSLLQPKYPGIPARILEVSALEGSGIAESWAAMEEVAETLRKGGCLAELHRAQLRGWFWSEVRAELAAALESEPGLGREAERLEGAVAAGQMLPGAAAGALIRAFRALDEPNPPS